MILEQSVRSLLVGATTNAQELSSATGFVVKHDDNPYLVTNWHVAAGREPLGGSPLSPTGAVPDELVIVHNVAGQLGTWQGRSEPLYDASGDPLWLEHPDHGRTVDVVALPLTKTTGVDLYPYDLSDPEPRIAFGPSDDVSIIGFPFGMTGGGAFGIWVQGTLATEPNVDFQDLPAFLVDSRTRSGQSGSPVIIYATSSFRSETGDVNIMTGARERFVGIYSGRTNEQSDLGIVWKAHALTETLEGQRRGPLPVIGAL